MEDIVEVFFGAGAVFEEFVFVAGEFEAFFAFSWLVELSIAIRCSISNHGQ